MDGNARMNYNDLMMPNGVPFSVIDDSPRDPNMSSLTDLHSHDIERLQNTVAQLLRNPRLSSGRYGELKPNQDVQRFNDNERVARVFMLTDVAVSGVTVGETYIELLSGSISPPAIDTSNKWVYYPASVTVLTRYVRAKALAMPVSVVTLPLFTIPIAHESLTAGTIRAGFGDGDMNTDPANGIYFRSANGGNWYAVCRKAGTETAVDTGCKSGTKPRQFKIDVQGDTVCVFTIDNSWRKVVSSNVPATNTVMIGRIGFEGTSAVTCVCRFGQWFSVAQRTKG